MIPLRPSASKMWTNCALQPRLARTVPQPLTSDPAREGQCAAWMAELVLKGVYKTADDMVGLSHENGWLCTPDMARHIQRYIDLLRSLGGEINVEMTVRLNEMIEGTPDGYAVAVNFDGRYVLFVIDLKYGYEIVEPERNTQVCIYAGAIMRVLMKKVTVAKVVIGIFQPRATHPDGEYRTWDVWPEDLMAFVREIEAAGHDCQAVDAMATPGHHCVHCPAAFVCDALAKSIYAGHRKISSDARNNLSASELAEELSFIDEMYDMVKARRDSIRAEADARIKASEHIPGYGFTNVYGNRRLNASPMAVIAATGVDPYEPRKLCTPAELERRGADPDAVARISERPRAAPKLTKLKPDHYKKIFGGKEGQI